jgi:hypothetical protein
MVSFRFELDAVSKIEPFCLWQSGPYVKTAGFLDGWILGTRDIRKKIGRTVSRSNRPAITQKPSHPPSNNPSPKTKTLILYVRSVIYIPNNRRVHAP